VRGLPVVVQQPQRTQQVGKHDACEVCGKGQEDGAGSAHSGHMSATDMTLTNCGPGNRTHARPTHDSGVL